MEVSTTHYDFAGWATCCNRLCSDGRTILPDAFKHQDGEIVPLVWNHDHNDPNNVLGKALLHSCDGSMRVYGLFNDTESGRTAKELVIHGDINALSIYANKLKHDAKRGVSHGAIREVSLVLAGANPGAFIDSVIRHGEESDEEGIIYTGEEISLYHAEENDKNEKETNNMAESNEKTVAEVFDELTEEQKTVVCAMIGQAIEDAKGETDDKDEKEPEGGNEMKHNLFDRDEKHMESDVLTHADQEAIIAMARTSGVGSLQQAIKNYFNDEVTLSHGIDDIEKLFPEFENLNPGAPELIRQDQSWVMKVINKIHKSPYSRIRTRQADARIAELRAHGYQKKGDEKTLSANIKLLGRTTDPQTVYRKDQLNRDDIVDITDFDVVAYQWGIMKDNMYEELALAALVGDGRDDGDPDKIHETHIRSILNDEELYAIHTDVDVAAAKAELQGTNTSANFGENYIYAEAIITAALYSREKFKGSGTPDLYCTPHLVNVMLLARDLNGRRIYDSKADLAKALNVNSIVEIEQLEGKTRETSDGDTKKLLGIFVNLADYQFGATKGGELTKFEDFDIDFNQYKYLMEARLSGALTKVYSAIVLEEPVVNAE